MQRVVILVSLVFCATPVWADRVVVDKATGRLLEYESGHPTPGVMTQNAVSAFGVDPTTVEEKEVTPQEWAAIKKQWITDPATAQQAVEKAKHQGNANKIKAKLGLSDADFESLKDALR